MTEENMTDKRDYYTVLGVSKSATLDEIKKAYRSMARKHHPDVDKTPNATERFKEINEAYQALSDPQKRQAYDQFGHAAFDRSQGVPGGAGGYAGGQQGPFSYSWSYGAGQPGQPGQDFDFGNFADPFEIFESFFGCQSPFSRGYRRKPTYQLHVTFDEAVRGVEKEVTIEGKKAKIKVPAGVDDGTRIQFDDFSIITSVGLSKEFKRQGYNIHVEVPVSFTQAALGDVVEVPTVDGKISVKIPAGIQSGTAIRLKEKGVPFVRGNGRGDQYVHISVITPTKLSNKEKELLKQLESVSSKNGKKWGVF